MRITFKKPEYLTITQLARMLGISRNTVIARWKSGLIPRPFKLGAAMNSPWKFPRAQIEAMLTNWRNGVAMSEMVAVGSVKLQEKELQLRASTLAQALGGQDLILAELRKLGASSIGSLHPTHYGEFRSTLLRLSRFHHRKVGTGQWKRSTEQAAAAARRVKEGHVRYLEQRQAAARQGLGRAAS